MKICYFLQIAQGAENEKVPALPGSAPSRENNSRRSFLLSSSQSPCCVSVSYSQTRVKRETLISGFPLKETDELYCHERRDSRDNTLKVSVIGFLLDEIN